MIGKLLFAGGMLGTLALVVWGITQMGSNEPQRFLPIGFGTPSGDKVEMHIAVSMFLPKADPPKLEGGVLRWDEWVSDHFAIRSATGDKVTLKRTNFTKHIPGQVAGTPEFYIAADLKPGATYVLELEPVRGGEEKWRHEFAAPTGPTQAEHVELTLAGG